MAEIGQDIARAKSILTKGGLVAIPTETVYGLAGNALNDQAVTSIFEAKNRPSFDPLIVHVASLESAAEYVEFIPENAIKLANTFWPGPLTILLKKKSIISDLVTSGLDTVAIRVPAQELTRSLLTVLDFPLAAPSANPFGYISPTKAEHVNAQLGDRLDYILDGGDCEVGLESTIVSFEHEVPKVMRLGGLSVEEIEQVIGPVQVANHSSSTPAAPGMLKSHYAPRKSIVLKSKFDQISEDKISEIGALLFDQFDEVIPKENQFLLSESGDLKEAASRLFLGLRTLDQHDKIKTIVTDFVPNIGLGRAINDRIKRATAKS
ncbi:L-threonylcarbamoyladenylate synthase [Roseivirga misakiensis]|uniref:Threonylcarbamoyl-AMP synthase n=1 Tax=Roseivirga misakiensis TaxID=1563681 RepID=A0A1E5SK57_9BACT|nr:L-threonylcarbamoyladenylate synthase [Roseivirga misakiensis]OEJ99491.1 threonylcarbamoyl-AMP synthase [Roseivirga misakiensis]